MSLDLGSNRIESYLEEAFKDAVGEMIHIEDAKGDIYTLKLLGVGFDYLTLCIKGIRVKFHIYTEGEIRPEIHCIKSTKGDILLNNVEAHSEIGLDIDGEIKKEQEIYRSRIFYTSTMLIPDGIRKFLSNGKKTQVELLLCYIFLHQNKTLDVSKIEGELGPLISLQQIVFKIRELLKKSGDTRVIIFMNGKIFFGQINFIAIHENEGEFLGRNMGRVYDCLKNGQEMSVEEIENTSGVTRKHISITVQYINSGLEKIGSNKRVIPTKKGFYKISK